MTFLDFGALFGALAISVPIIIHLLNKFQVKKVQWAAMRFIEESLQRNQRRIQIQDLLLLLLRCLSVLLLALTFARPVFFRSGGAVGESGNAVILIDDSMSMSYSADGKSNFELAREAARKVIDDLDGNSRVALYFVSNRVKQAVSPPSRDLNEVRRVLASAQVTNRSSDLWPGVKSAVKELQNADGPGKLYIITDNQTLAWRHSQEILDMQSQVQPGITFKFIPIGSNGEQNMSVSSVHIDNTLAVANQPVRSRVSVTNWGTDPAKGVKVSLAIDRAAPSAETTVAEIESGQTATVSFVSRFQEAGFHSLSASIPTDKLPMDNSRSATFEVLKDLRVLVVTGSPSASPVDGDGFFLQNALVPVSAAQQAQYYLKVRGGLPGDLERPLNDYRIIFLSNVSQLSPSAVDNLSAFVKNGGGLAVFTGEKVDTDFYNTNPKFSALLPAHLKRPESPANHKVLGLQSNGFTHPLTVFWNSPQNGDLGSVYVSRYSVMTLNFPSDDAKRGGIVPQVVATYVDGTPAIASQQSGKGQVILFGMTATPAWGNFPLQPSFVPLLQRMVSYMVKRQDTELILDPGSVFSEGLPPEDAGKEFFVHQPNDTVEKRSAGHVEVDGDQASLRFSDTEIPGAYEVFIGDATRAQVFFSVQTRPEESNLARVAPTLQMGDGTKGTETAAAASQSPVNGARATVSLWLPFFCFAFFAVLLEMLLAYLFSRNRRVTVKPT